MKVNLMSISIVFLILLVCFTLVGLSYMEKTKPTYSEYENWVNEKYGVQCSNQDCKQITDDVTIPLTLSKNIKNDNPFFLSTHQIYRSGEETGVLTVKSIGMFGRFFTVQYSNNY